MVAFKGLSKGSQKHFQKVPQVATRTNGHSFATIVAGKNGWRWGQYLMWTSSRGGWNVWHAEKFKILHSLLSFPVVLSNSCPDSYLHENMATKFGVVFTVRYFLLQDIVRAAVYNISTAVYRYIPCCGMLRWSVNITVWLGHCACQDDSNKS